MPKLRRTGEPAAMPDRLRVFTTNCTKPSPAPAARLQLSTAFACFNPAWAWCRTYLPMPVITK